MKFPEDCPCTRECPDRNVDFCKTCEKYKLYEKEKFEKYRAAQPAKSFRSYQYEVGFKYAVKTAKYLKRNAKRR